MTLMPSVFLTVSSGFGYLCCIMQVVLSLTLAVYAGIVSARCRLSRVPRDPSLITRAYGDQCYLDPCVLGTFENTERNVAFRGSILYYFYADATFSAFSCKCFGISTFSCRAKVSEWLKNNKKYCN